MPRPRASTCDPAYDPLPSAFVPTGPQQAVGRLLSGLVVRGGHRSSGSSACMTLAARCRRLRLPPVPPQQVAVRHLQDLVRLGDGLRRSRRRGRLPPLQPQNAHQLDPRARLVSSWPRGFLAAHAALCPPNTRFLPSIHASSQALDPLLLSCCLPWNLVKLEIWASH